MRILATCVVTKLPEIRKSSKSGKHFTYLLMQDKGSLVCAQATDARISNALLQLKPGDIVVISGEGQPAITNPREPHGGVKPGLIVQTDFVATATVRVDARAAACRSAAA